MNTGVHTKTIDMELSRNPSPDNQAKAAISIGLRVQAYGPTVTTSGGGLTGTPVPFALQNNTRHQTCSTRPAVRRGIPMAMPNAPGRSRGRPSAPAMCRLPKTTRRSRPTATTRTMGVRTARRRLEPVVTEQSRLSRLISTPCYMFSGGRQPSDMQ